MATERDAASSGGTYAPLNTLKPVADNIWLVDGPAIRFGPGCFKMPFPSRMTVVRVGAADLFIHSPTALTPGLRAELSVLGRPRWLVGPNRLHYWWLPEWHRAYPDAEVHLAPGIRERAGRHIDFSTTILNGADHHPWRDALETLPITSRYMTEVVFFHRASRTLILTDLIENFEAEKLGRAGRWLTRLGGARHPDGQMPRDMRLTFIGRRADLKEALETLLGWNPERVILAHGRWYVRDGAAELRRAFRWLG
jgi:hypothetical protein